MTTIALQADVVSRLVAKRSFCTLATTSSADQPHAVGVLYATVGSTLYVNTRRDSRKARNLADNPKVGVCIPIRRLPVGPPSSVQFQAIAEVLAVDDPHIAALVQRDELKSITGHGELDDPDNCFLRITPTGRVNTYGLGMSLWKLMRDPLHAAGQTQFPTDRRVHDAEGGTS